MQKRDFETYQKRFRDFEILPKFSETHVFRGTIRHLLYPTVLFKAPVSRFNLKTPDFLRESIFFICLPRKASI